MLVPVRAQNAGFIQLAEAFSAGRGAIGKTVEKGQLLATIADETTARQLKQARADLQAATQRAELPLPSAEALKVAEDNLGRLDKLTALSNVPAVEYEKARSEVNRLRGLLESERIERDRNLAMLEDAHKKLEAQLKNSEIRSPMDGLLTAIKTIEGELVADRSRAVHGFVPQELCARRSGRGRCRRSEGRHGSGRSRFMLSGPGNSARKYPPSSPRPIPRPSATPSSSTWRIRPKT